jgi:hypothetical protein
LPGCGSSIDVRFGLRARIELRHRVVGAAGAIRDGAPGDQLRMNLFKVRENQHRGDAHAGLPLAPGFASLPVRPSNGCPVGETFPRSTYNKPSMWSKDRFSSIDTTMCWMAD